MIKFRYLPYLDKKFKASLDVDSFDDIKVEPSDTSNARAALIAFLRRDLGKFRREGFNSLAGFLYATAEKATKANTGLFFEIIEGVSS